MTENKKPSFIKIAPGAIVTGLEATDNTIIGDANFINNEGELKNAKLERNRHIIPANPETKNDYSGGATWVDKEYDPYFKEKEQSLRFVFLKSAWSWLLNNIVVKVIVGIIIASAMIYVSRLL